MHGEAQQRKGAGAQSGTQWDLERFRAHLLQTSGAASLEVADALMRWAERNGGRATWGRGTRAGSFVPVFSHNGEDFYPFAVCSSGSLEVYFQWSAYRAALSDVAPRQTLMDRLNAIPGVSIPSEKLSGRPTLSLTLFHQSEQRAAMLAAFDWALEHMRTTG